LALDLSLVIPSHHRADRLRACLASIKRHAPPRTEVIVVDDASPGGIISACAAEFMSVTVLRVARRRGFCRAANAGIWAARHPIIELLNDDTEVTAGWAEPAVAAFADPTIGAVAPLVLYWPGGEVGEARIDSAGDRYFHGGIAGKRGHGQILTSDYLRREKVFGASASAAFYRRHVLLDLGGFPESFDAYFEDVDLSFRLHWAGFDVVYEPASRVLHHVSSSYGKSCRRLLEQQSRNEERVFWRNLRSSDLFRALPAHLSVLAAKAWRRWRAGDLVPFARGRLQALREIPTLLQHRRRLRRFAACSDRTDWCLEGHFWKA
jgi:GT2 family glycosyltransferase